MALFDATKETCSRWVVTFATLFVCKEYSLLVFFSVLKKIVSYAYIITCLDLRSNVFVNKVRTKTWYCLE